MPYVPVPKDFTKVKAKVLMGLTKRQLAAAAAAAALCLPLYFLLRRPLGDFALYLCVLLAVPIFMLGFYHAKDGRPAEDVAMNYIRVRYLQPRTLYYQPDNMYSYLGLYQQLLEVTKHEPDPDAAHSQAKAHGPLRRFAPRKEKKGHSAD